MHAASLLLPLLLVWICSLLMTSAQAPYGQMGEAATQYQHRWTDELEFAMLHQQMQPPQQQQHTHAAFLTQQAADSPPPHAITDTRQPHAFTPISATATGQQPPSPPPPSHETTQPHLSIPLANIVVDSLTPSDTTNFDTSSTDTTNDEFDTTQAVPFNDTLMRRVRAACSLRCGERVMEVAGEGRVRINSSRAVIRATIEYKEQLKSALLASSTTAAALHALLLSASNQTATTAAAVLGYLQSDKLKGRLWQLHTTSTLVEPLYQYVNGSQLTDGYRASLSFSLQASMANASAILTGILDRGVTRIDSVAYEAAEADTAAARQKAVKRAVHDALLQATTVVEGMQRTLRSLHKRAAPGGGAEAESADSSGRELQVISMRVTGVSMPSSQLFYPSQTRIFGLSGATSRLFVDESVMSIPLIAEEKVISATVQMKVRF